MQKSIILTENQKRVLLKHASNWIPNESCAILFGKVEDDKNVVTEVFLADNIEESPVNFTVSNDELLKAYKLAEEKKLEVVGIFHSHPGSEAYPSSTDRKFMNSNPVPWLIYSADSKELRAYLLEDKIIEIPIIIS